MHLNCVALQNTVRRRPRLGAFLCVRVKRPTIRRTASRARSATRSCADGVALRVSLHRLNRFVVATKSTLLSPYNATSDYGALQCA
ncbi:hypothetical protein EVAR_13899_1 [Eumeta japonica]|uniref:Uncharacterized protein n=1 Tax=Eumeta variegata TaxID=151549 RepID=A0A4C1U8H6_EUMVA|nr:hypothetical protein EVAR_13899_1 [Eumeta japonica]